MNKIVVDIRQRKKKAVTHDSTGLVFNIEEMDVHVGDYEAGVLHDARYIALLVSQLRHSCDTLLKIKHKDALHVKARTLDIHNTIEALLEDAEITLHRLKVLNIDIGHIDYLKGKFNNNITRMVKQRVRLKL